MWHARRSRVRRSEDRDGETVAVTGSTSGVGAPRPVIALDIAPSLRDQLPALAAGRALVIDYYAGARCGTVVGDLTAKFRPMPTNDAYVPIASIDGVRVFAEARLIRLLEDAGGGLDLGGLPFARHLVVTLRQPELWLAFLDRPGVCAGKGPWARWRQR